MSSNLLKWSDTRLAHEDKRVIDTNELVTKRIEALGRLISEEENSGFADSIQTDEEEIEKLLCRDEAQEPEEADEAPQLQQEIYDRADEILAQAKKEAQGIIDTARRQAELEADEIRENARQQGFSQGSAQAEEAYSRKVNELAQERQQMAQEYEEWLSDAESEMVDHLSAIYEQLFHVELGSYKNILMGLLEDTMKKAENCKEFLIHVSPADYAYVSAHKEELANQEFLKRCNIDIVEDMTLEENQCLVETGSGIFDCGLDTQLTQLTKRLRLLSLNDR